MNKQDILHAIAAGELDDHLDDLKIEVHNACVNRYRVKGQNRRMRPGLHVINGHISPKYLRGCYVDVILVGPHRSVCTFLGYDTQLPQAGTYAGTVGRFTIGNETTFVNSTLDPA